MCLFQRCDFVDFRKEEMCHLTQPAVLRIVKIMLLDSIECVTTHFVHGYTTAG
jgi:hypothetical protein